MNEDLFLILISIATIMILLDLMLSSNFNWAESLSNMAAWALTLAIGSLAIPLITPIYHWAYGQPLFILDNSNVWTIVAAVFIYDFLYYWYHRLSHAFWVLWNVHAVHHQATQLTPSLGLKSSILDFAVICLVTIPMVLMGFGSQSLIVALGIHAIYQIFLHHQWQFSLGPFERVFNTHNHHALHHATNKEYLDKNFGSILIIWDKVFGTFAKKHREPNIGILGGNYAHDPVLSNVMPWLANRLKFDNSHGNLYLMLLSYFLAAGLILSWLFSTIKIEAVLYVIPALLIFHTLLQLLIISRKTQST
jgi:sterol desaturase/sphingolipid hydroxylase (fatty acid hydroxylase superfamily)